MAKEGLLKQLMVGAAGNAVYAVMGAAGGLVLLAINFISKLSSPFYELSIAGSTLFIGGSILIGFAWFKYRPLKPAPSVPLTEEGQKKLARNLAEFSRLSTEGRALTVNDGWNSKKRHKELTIGIQKWRTEVFWFLKHHIQWDWALRTFWELAYPWNPKSVSLDSFKAGLNQLEIIASDFHDIVTKPAPRQLTRSTPSEPPKQAPS